MCTVQKMKIVHTYNCISHSRGDSGRRESIRVGRTNGSGVCLDFDQYFILKFLLQNRANDRIELYQENERIRVRFLNGNMLEQISFELPELGVSAPRLFPFVKDMDDPVVSCDVQGAQDVLMLLPFVNIYNRCNQISERNSLIHLCRYPICSVRLVKCLLSALTCYMIDGHHKKNNEIYPVVTYALRSLQHTFCSVWDVEEGSEVWDKVDDYRKFSPYPGIYSNENGSLIRKKMDQVDNGKTVWENCFTDDEKMEMIALFRWMEQMKLLLGVHYIVPHQFYLKVDEEAGFDSKIYTNEEMYQKTVCKIKEIDEQVKKWDWEHIDALHKRKILNTARIHLCRSQNIPDFSMCPVP